jgi:hypothetical protein
LAWGCWEILSKSCKSTRTSRSIKDQYHSKLCHWRVSWNKQRPIYCLVNPRGNRSPCRPHMSSCTEYLHSM